MTTIADVRANLRLDLKDPAGATQRWTDEELDRAIGLTVKRYSHAWPRTLSTIQQCQDGVYRYDVFAADPLLANFLGALWVEYPNGLHPPVYVPYRFEGSELVLVVDRAPQATESLCLFYAALHLLDANTTTISVAHQRIVEGGAAGYAAEMWASNAVNRINASADTYRQYRQLADDRQAEFNRELKELQRRQAHVAPSTVAITGYEV